jgi:hypothetical protein
MLLFDSRKIILSRSRPSFEALPTRLENPHSAIRNAWRSRWWTFLIWNHSLQDFGYKVLVANNAQRCFPILLSLWQLSTNKESNTKHHIETSNIFINKTLHEMRIGFVGLIKPISNTRRNVVHFDHIFVTTIQLMSKPIDLTTSSVFSPMCQYSCNLL